LIGLGFPPGYFLDHSAANQKSARSAMKPAENTKIAPGEAINELVSPLLPVFPSQSENPIEALEDFASVLELLLDNAFSGIILCDRESRILYMNRFYAELLGTDRKDAVGKHIREYFPKSRLPTVLETGRMELGKRCSLRADIALLVNRVPIKTNGQTIGVVLQTIFKDLREINDLMGRLQLLEKEVKFYKRGLKSVLSATYNFDSIIGNNGALLDAKTVAEKYARTDSPVLILGATGTGKELFAHAIHNASPRKGGAFVCVNCAAIPKELLESELFGYETGAFTGARRKGKAGKIELADKGTLFLDEIGDLPHNAQAKLLRVLETRKVERLGGLKTLNVDFRLVASTNRNLREMIENDHFREDLFYRMNTLSVEIPSLSERAEDIPALVHHFIHTQERPGLEVDHAASEMLKAYAWPGNVRELKNVIERAVSLTEKDTIELEHLPCEVKEFSCRTPQAWESSTGSLSMALSRCERDILEEALRVTNRNMSKTAKLLGISRSTLYEKCKAHKI
jgi:PAS domain S-box-containing protein